MNLTLSVNIPVTVREEDNVFVADCPILDVASQGSTEEEAKKMLIEAVGLFLGTCIEMGTFSQVLKDCGFAPARSIPEAASDEFDHLQVPLPFIANKALAECHA